MVYKAGFIPYFISDDLIYMLFMKPSDPDYGGTKFQIAKGRCDDENSEQDTSLLDCALREAEEELGLLTENLIKETIKFVDEALGIAVYCGEVRNKDMFKEPHYETKETKWLTLEEFYNEGRLTHIPLVKKTAELIGQIRNGE